MKDNFVIVPSSIWKHMVDLAVSEKSKLGSFLQEVVSEHGDNLIGSGKLPTLVDVDKILSRKPNPLRTIPSIILPTIAVWGRSNQNESLERSIRDLLTYVNPNAATDLVGREASFILTCWTSVGRYYHTPTHLIQCLNLWNSIKHMLNNDKHVLVALLFHDAVYEPSSSTNEENSADLARHFCRQFGFEDKTGLVETLILQSKTHVPDFTSDSQYFCDIDMAILGSSSAVYTNYEQSIQQEYSFVDPAVFRSKRVEMIEKWLMKPRIYYTSEFFELFEAKARENLNATLFNYSIST